MISNNIRQRIQQIKLYSSQGNQTILSETNARILLSYISDKDLKDPATTYCDPQCGSGSIMLVLADILMEKLARAIPDEKKRLEHIFKNQIFVNDISSTQARIARSNFKRALNDKNFPVNVTEKDCFDLIDSYSYVISSVDFKTINRFVPIWRKLCSRLIIVSRSNKIEYSAGKITEISVFRHLERASTSLLSMMVFEPVKTNTIVEFADGETTLQIDNPKRLPGSDLKLYAYAHEVCSLGLPGINANYGSYVSNHPAVLNNPGRTPLIYQVGARGKGFLKVIKVSSKIITPQEGVGLHKVVISKNGNPNNQSVLKYAGPEYGTGHNSLWIEVKNAAEAKKMIEYWESPPIVALSLSLNSNNPANGKGFWLDIPTIDNYNTIKKIYDKHYKS
jgi:hypothetical protein